MIQELNFRIVGVSPLLMHNGQLADPSNIYARKMKEISSKRSKTDADYEEMAKLEWFGSLYLLNKEPCIPGLVFEAALIGKGGAARKERMGKEAAAALWVVDDFPLEYTGPKDPYELWEDEHFRFQSLVRVQTSRVLRTRPIFRQWAASIKVQFDGELLNEADVRRWIEVAGVQSGLMDWRPKFGRYGVEWP